MVESLYKLKNESSSESEQSGPKGLILSPTRELALQTYRFLRKLSKHTGLRSITLTGGENLNDQFSDLTNSSSSFDIIVATPGRLVHLLSEIPHFKISKVQFLVFDEGDRLFEMGFSQQIYEIMQQMNKGSSSSSHNSNHQSRKRQTLLVSATLPSSLIQFTRAGLNDPVLIRFIFLDRYHVFLMCLCCLDWIQTQRFLKL